MIYDYSFQVSLALCPEEDIRIPHLQVKALATAHIDWFASQYLVGT